MNRGYIFIFLATIFFSSMEAALKTVAFDFHPMQMNCTRFLIGGLLLLPPALHSLRRKGTAIPARAWTGYAGLAFVGLVVSMMLYQCSILRAPASVISVLFSCNPILVFAFAFLILKAEITREHVFALLLEAAGAFLIIDPFNARPDMSGVVLVLLSAALFALYVVLGKRYCTAYGALASTSFICLAASAEMLILMGISHIPCIALTLDSAGLGMFARIPFLEGYTASNIPAFLYICVFVTAGGFACHLKGIELTSPVTGSIPFFFKPVLAPLFAMAVLGESIPAGMWAGIAVMLLASFISMLPAIRASRLRRSILQAERPWRPSRHGGVCR